MNLRNARVLLTGATGGIGSELAVQLADRGARLVLIGRNHAALAALCAKTGAQALIFDFAKGGDYGALLTDSVVRLGGIDLLINNAGEAAFLSFETQQPEHVEALVAVNLLAPMLLTRAALAHMHQGAHIVNVGSVFGHVGFPYHAAYSATKFGLRGFSEALRRELAVRNIGVTYVAPRATRTTMNSEALYRFAERTRMPFDAPADVARQIIAAIEDEAAERVLGRRETFFSRLNALLPRFVDRALRKQSDAAREVLQGTSRSTAAAEQSRTATRPAA